MKYLIALLLGLLFGAVIFVAGVVYNPFSSVQGLSPIAVSDARILALSYAADAPSSIMYSNDGESRAVPHPEKVLQLWEAPIRQTSAMVTSIQDSRNETVGLGIKISSLSEKTQLLQGEAIVDSIWYVYLPGRGGLFVEQTENYWDYLRNIVLPAYRSTADTWAGSWLGNVTSGPGSLGTARVIGGNGEFADIEMLGVESLSVRAWRVDGGAVAAEGRLLFELPKAPETSDPDAEVDQELD